MMTADDEIESLKYEFLKVINKLQQRKPLTVDPCDGMTQAEANALHAIGLLEQNDGYEARPGLIAAHINVTPSALSQVLKVLEDKNLVMRKRTNRDCRVVVLSLTTDGRKLFNKINDRWEPRMSALIQAVGIDNLMTTIKTIDSIIECDQKLFDAGGEIEQVLSRQVDLKGKTGTEAPRGEKKCS